MKSKNNIQNVKLAKLLAVVQLAISIMGILCAGFGIYTLSRLLNGQDLSQMKQSAPWIMVVFGAFCFLFFLSVVFTIVWIPKTFSKPLEKMKNAIQDFSKGKLKADLSAEAQNEIGGLTNSLGSAFVKLKKDIDEILKMLERISDGDLATEVTRDFEGDFAPITASFREILQKLNHTFAIMESTSDQVDSGAQQVSATAEQLAQGATEQAASVEELSSSTQEISKSIDETSKHISKVTSFMAKTIDDVHDSNDQVEQMLTAMGEINTSADEIQKIIKVIDEIAFQTNILALNAAVEAARAGDAGKGFAVVADEVRSLAGKSADAASKTTALIESAIAKVKDGTEIADKTAESLKQVSGQIGEINEAVEKIDRASSTQSGAVQQITQGLEQISSVVQTNSASAEESAAASEELSGQANLLRKELSRFRLKKDSAVSSGLDGKNKKTALHSLPQSKKTSSDLQKSVS